MLKKDAKWMWTEKCQSAFEMIKKALTSDLSLMYFDPKLNIVVTLEASDLGTGAVILHMTMEQLSQLHMCQDLY